MEIVKGKIGNAITSTADNHVVAVAHDIYDESQERYQDEINAGLLNRVTNTEEQVFDLLNGLGCYNSGQWVNELKWSDISYWENSNEIVDSFEAVDSRVEHLENTHSKDIKVLVSRFEQDEAIVDEIVDTLIELDHTNDQEHNLINLALQSHAERLDSLEILIEEHDSQISDLLNSLNCFGDGQWNNDLKWSNSALWENSNLMCETFVDVYAKIQEHQNTIQDLTNQIAEIENNASETLKAINATFNGFRKEHEDFRKDHADFTKEHNEFKGRLDSHDALCEEQQREIDTLLHRISLLTNGQWDNVLLWINDSEWVNHNENAGCQCPDNTEERLDETEERLDSLHNVLEEICQEINDHEVAIVDCQTNIEANRSDVDALATSIKNHSSELMAIREDAIKEHRAVAYQLRAIGREQISQNESIAKLGGHFSCYADGIWGNLFIWDNELLWANQTGVVNEAISDLRNDLRDTRQKLNEANEDIMTNLSLIRANHQLIEENSIDIQNNKDEIENTQSDLQATADEIRKDAIAEHRQIVYQLRAIGRDQEAQNDNIAKLGEHFSCFADGVWGDLFLWDNDHLWANATGVITTAFEDIHIELDSHKETLDLIIEEKDEHFTCFSDDAWCNSSVWENGRLWPSDFSNFAQAIQKNAKDIMAINESVEDFKTEADERIEAIENALSQVSDEISEVSSTIQDNHKLIEDNAQQINSNVKDIQKLENAVATLQSDAIAEHRQIAYELRSIAREQGAQDENTSKVGEHFGCFVDGKWCDVFLWDNDHFWHNETGVVEEAIADTNERIDAIANEIEDINQKAEEHQSEYQELLNDIRSYNGCFEKGEWASPFFWNDTDVWYNSPNTVSEAEIEIIKHDTRLTALESQFQLFLQQFAAQQTIIEQQQERLDALMDCFSTTNVGRWQNILLWDNEAIWSDSLIAGSSNGPNVSDPSSVTVKSYDPQTSTVTL